jgi:hypothetical protein
MTKSDVNADPSGPRSSLLVLRKGTVLTNEVFLNHLIAA